MNLLNLTLGILLAWGICGFAVADSQTLSAGVGRAVITPKEPMWMGGYASRTAPSDGKVHDLWAKALVLEDATGARSVVVTTDLLGVSASLSTAVAGMVETKLGIPRERLMMTSSHTHSGPVVRDNLINMYGLTEEAQAKVSAYTATLPALIFEAIEQAISDLEPSDVRWAVGHTDFARNRRGYTQGGVNNSINPIGPVDHDVPTLTVRRANDGIKAVLFGYACHNTCTSDQQFCGDYAGFAQIDIEARLPGATALFAAGCGGDQNPLPRRTMSLSQLYGEMLGKAVVTAVSGKGTPVAGPLRARYDEIPLNLSAPPDRASIEAELESSNIYRQRWAKHQVRVLDEKGSLQSEYPFPVQVWQFASGLQITALGGESVVDYALRIKQEFGRENQFVIAYANDVCSYIPSLRVLREEGYEGKESMMYYGFHGPWAPPVEEDIMAAVHRLADRRTLVDLSNTEAVRARAPLRIAHRGGVITQASPECSREAIWRASLAGYDMVELDLQESADGEPIVFHNKDLQDACGLSGAVADRTETELRAIPYSGSEERILHLGDALALCAQENLGVMLDIKVTGSPAFYRRIIGQLERFDLKKATLCINGAPDVREHLGGKIMLRLTQEQLDAHENDAATDLSGGFWFGIAADLSDDRAVNLQKAGALVIPAVNTFRYDAATHREKVKADVDRLCAAGVDGFQLDSAYQDYFGMPLPE